MEEKLPEYLLRALSVSRLATIILSDIRLAGREEASKLPLTSRQREQRVCQEHEKEGGPSSWPPPAMRSQAWVSSLGHIRPASLTLLVVWHLSAQNTGGQLTSGPGWYPESEVGG